MNAGASGIFSNKSTYWGTTAERTPTTQAADHGTDQAVEAAEGDGGEGVDER